MNPYVSLAAQIGTPEAASLSARLTAWHDAMVAHLRRLRTIPADALCDDECPHVQARSLWSEAVAIFGASADRLSFLRSHGVSSSLFRATVQSSRDAAVEV